MSTYEELANEIRGVIAANASADILSPTFIALRVYAKYGADGDDAHVKYAAVQHLKQMARAELRGKFDTDSDESIAYTADMFSGTLQERYPVPFAQGADPQYKLRALMSDVELLWNIARLEKSSDARREHARALRAYRDKRRAA